MSPKKQIRKVIREKRRALSKTERQNKNEAIRKNLEHASLFQQAQTVLCYLSTPEEVDTHALIQSHLHKKTIAVPSMQKDTHDLRLIHLTDWNDLAPNATGILEVQTPDAPTIDENTIDLTLVPGVAFDRSGHRIGYGKGYYDRLLKRTTGIHIGLAYDCQLVEKIPHEPHDVAVDHIVTETSIL